MTGSHTPTPQRRHPPATPWWRRLLRRWPETTVLLLLGLLVWTIRLPLRERGAGGALAAITLWVVMGIPAVLDHDDRAHDHPLPPRSHK